MKIKCGWAEFIDPIRDDVVARGSVSAGALPNVLDGVWDGEVRLLRGYEDLVSRAQRVWLLRFERGEVHRWIELQGVERQWAPSGMRATAQVRSWDGLVPPVVNELGGE